MRTRMIIGGCLVMASLGAAVPATVAVHAAGPVPPACVVVNGPSGATVQAGYAPNGPGDCTTLP
jgi:hypothetical protein